MIKTVWSITLSVSNLERSKGFYEEILGFNKNMNTRAMLDSNAVEWR